MIIDGLNRCNTSAASASTRVRSSRHHFAENGKIAFGIKYTDRGMEIINNLSQIDSVLFHTWKKDEQRYFAVTDECKIAALPDVPDYYMARKNPTHPDGTPDEAQFLHVLITLDMANPLDATNIDCNKNKYSEPTQRYDAQFALLSELLSY